MGQTPLTDWYSCDGKGGTGAPPRSRRSFLRAATGGIAGAALAAWASQRSALAQIAVDPAKEDGPGDVLVVIFLRGAADGLSMVVPHGDDDYYRARPTLALAAPAKGGSTGDGKNGKTVRLDDFFALHPALAPLYPYYADGSLAAVHAIGSQDQTRSHFEAMAAMERGLASDAGHEASGWLARHLTSAAPYGGGPASPLRAVAFGSILPDSLRGASDTSVLSSLADFRLDLPRPELALSLAALYESGQDAASFAGRETLAVLEALKRLDPAHYKPENGAAYPGSDLGNGLRQTACLIKARLGLEVACLDRGGWDTHVGQGGTIGWLAIQLTDVADSLAAFARDLGPAHLKRVTTIVMTEFGRRVRENSGLGTDHGRASAMFLLGGGVNGGKVYADWPGLADDRLEPPGDLRVTTDYRDVLAEVVANRLGNRAHLDAVFPGATPRYRGIVRSMAKA